MYTIYMTTVATVMLTKICEHTTTSRKCIRLERDWLRTGRDQTWTVCYTSNLMYISKTMFRHPPKVGEIACVPCVHPNSGKIYVCSKWRCIRFGRGWLRTGWKRGGVQEGSDSQVQVQRYRVQPGTEIQGTDIEYRGKYRSRVTPRSQDIKPP